MKFILTVLANSSTSTNYLLNKTKKKYQESNYILEVQQVIFAEDYKESQELNTKRSQSRQDYEHNKETQCL